MPAQKIKKKRTGKYQYIKCMQVVARLQVTTYIQSSDHTMHNKLELTVIKYHISNKVNIVG